MQTVEFYDRWVNGRGLRLVELLSGKWPKQAPERSLCSTDNTAQTTIALQRYEDVKPKLPVLDSGALLPVSHVLLHGSMATGDSCAFSDIDIAVIIEDRRAFPAEQHRDAVFELRRLLHAALAYDPLMHHGLMFIGASTLDNYDQRFLPVDTLRKARVLHGPPVLELSVTDASHSAFVQKLRQCAASLRKHVGEHTFWQNDFRLKNFLSGALLMPARVLAARGTHVYKRESFEMARDLFDRADWEFIARCEGLRVFWKSAPDPLPHRWVPDRCHPRLLEVVGSRTSSTLNARRLSKQMIEGLLRSAQRFLDRVEAIA